MAGTEHRNVAGRPAVKLTYDADGSRDMDLQLIEQEGVKAVEGAPEELFMSDADDARRVIEACMSHDTSAVLLYAKNLPDGFFDLSSGLAGAVLQKLRNYRVRLAVVCPPGDVQFSSRFAEMLAEERRGPYFGVFDTRASALDWLARR